MIAAAGGGRGGDGGGDDIEILANPIMSVSNSQIESV